MDCWLSVYSSLRLFSPPPNRSNHSSSTTCVQVCWNYSVGDIKRMTVNKTDRSQVTLFFAADPARPDVFRFDAVAEFTDALRASVQLVKLLAKHKGKCGGGG